MEIRAKFLNARSWSAWTVSERSEVSINGFATYVLLSTLFFRNSVILQDESLPFRTRHH